MYASLMIIVQFEIWGPFMPTCCFSLIFISFIYIYSSLMIVVRFETRYVYIYL